MIGAVIVRDTFYVEANNESQCNGYQFRPHDLFRRTALGYASLASRQREFSFGGSVAGDPGEEDINDGGAVTRHLPGRPLLHRLRPGVGGGEEMTSSQPPGPARWIEVRPQPQPTNE